MSVTIWVVDVIDVSLLLVMNKNQQGRASIYVNAQLFFLNSAQRSPGRFDSDGRSCVVGRAQHSPFVSTTMQVQEGGDVIVKEEDM